MRSSIVLKVLVTPVIVAVTFYATNAIIAQQKRKPQKNVTRDLTPAVSTVPTTVPTSEVAVVPAVKQTRVPNLTIISSGTMKEYQVDQNGRVLHIKAHVLLQDSRNLPFVWQVRIFEENLNEVFVKSYNEQMFRVNPGEAIEPKFEDFIQVNLPAGNYAVETSLYLVTPEYGLEGMKNPDIARDLRSPVGVRTFTLGE